MFKLFELFPWRRSAQDDRYTHISPCPAGLCGGVKFGDSCPTDRCIGPPAECPPELAPSECGKWIFVTPDTDITRISPILTRARRAELEI